MLSELLVSNVFMTHEIVTPDRRLVSGVVRCPMRTDSPKMLSTVANILALSPGTMAVDATDGPPVLFVHVLSHGDLDDMRRKVSQAGAARGRGDRLGRGSSRSRRGECAMIVAVLVVLGVAAALFAVRLVVGPTLADRVVALNGMLIVGMVLLAELAVETGRGTFLPVLVLLSVVGFLGTAMIARFLEGRGR